MPHAGSKLVPIGCNMNDAAYPFRGEHRLADCINHGHSGVIKKIPTSIAIRISGSNLVIEQVKTPKGIELECELGVDGGIPRPVSLQHASAFMVPGDGHDYNLTTTVKASGNAAKHYCKLTFNGSEGTSVLRVRAPEGCSPDAVYFVVDGRRLRPAGGWFRIPIQAKECALAVHFPLDAESPLSLSPAVTPPPLPVTFDGLAERAPETATGGVPDLETRIQPPLIPGAGVGSPTGACNAATMPSFVASAPNFRLQLSGENGSTAFGVGVASLPLSRCRAQTVHIVVSDALGRVVLRQRSHVPSLELEAVCLHLKDDSSGELAVSGNVGSRLTVCGVPQAGPAATAVLPRVVAQQVVVEQANADGSVSKAVLDVAPKSGPGPIPIAAPLPPPPPPPSAQTQAQPESWVKELCDMLQNSDPEEQRRLVQSIHPSTIAGRTIVNFIRDQLTCQPPAIAFTVTKERLEGVHCPGCSVNAAVGSDPAHQIPAFGSVALTSGKSTLLTATNMLTQRAVSSCRVQMVMPSPVSLTSAKGSAEPPVPAGVSGDCKADNDLVSRLVDCLLRHNMSAQPVAKELESMPTALFSAQGRRLLPLLASCLHGAAASAAAAATPPSKTEATAAAPAEIFFTCGPGYLDNIYTSQPHYHLSGAVGNQEPQALPQRGRIPSQGVFEGEHRAFVVSLTARDPITGAIKAERTITVLGARPVPKPTPPAVEATPPAQRSGPPAPTPTEAPAESGAQAALRGFGATSAGAPAPMREEPLAPGGTELVIPYLDVSLQVVGQDVQARILCSPHLRIVCDVDGVGGNTGLSDFVAKMPASRLHQVNLSLLDFRGRVVWQQKLTIPSMVSHLWGLALQQNGLAVDPESGSVATASVDRALERALQGNFVAFDASVPHFVHLRKYHNGLHGTCVGEVSLRLPGLMLPPELEEVTRIMRLRADGQVSDPQAKAELQQLRARSTAPAILELINSILDGWSAPDSANVRTSGADSPSSRIFFRLTGTD
ncbi:hypothetical protein LSCM1_03806 [Leishmania martiniquensis]|uniref:Uncharacterized protein n=1 Tax=Leishmania martiniquensis TaxID=1580590 RepID=A0A836FZV2_9TRYP|nr:hypothetical protein LSCM1_03806 [Leishmania martiniquensis]